MATLPVALPFTLQSPTVTVDLAGTSSSASAGTGTVSRARLVTGQSASASSATGQTVEPLPVPDRVATVETGQVWYARPGFDDALLRSHELAVGVDVLRDGQVTGALAVTAGSVTDRASALFRRQLSVSVAALDLRELDPLRDELRPWRGVRYPDGTTESRPLGVYRIASDQITAQSATVSLSCYDRMWEVARGGRLDDVTVASGVKVTTAIVSLLHIEFPGAPVNVVSSDVTLAAARRFVAGGDPARDLVDLAKSIGYDVYPDANGIFVVRPTPDPDTQPPVTTLRDGRGGRLVAAARNRDYADAITRAVVDSVAANGTPLRGVAGDVRGPTAHLVTSYAPSQTAVNLAAVGLLRRKAGALSKWQLDVLAHPELQSQDVAYLEVDVLTGTPAEQRLTDIVQLEAITTPIAVAGTQQVETRERRVSAATAAA